MVRVFDAIVKIIVLTILATNSTLAEQLAFPAPDITAPVLEQKEFISKVEPGKDHQIVVTATDDTGVKSVVLFYRVIGAKKYQTKTMRNVAGSDDYAATFSADELNGDGIEYYIQASDKAGNTLLLGYAFSPLTVTIDREVAKTQVATVAKPKKKTKNENSYNKWLWIGLGVLAVGAIASSGGGDGGGSSGQEPTITINAPVPQ